MKTQTGTNFKLFQCCIPTIGFGRTLLLDLQRCNIQMIPNELFNLMNKAKGDYSRLLKSGGPDNLKIIKEYMDFLIKNEYIFTFDKTEESLFPSMTLNYYSPHDIENAVITFSDFFHINDYIHQLDQLRCLAIFVDLTKIDCGKNNLVNILESFNTSSIRHIQIAVNYHKFLSSDIQYIINQYLKIDSLIIIFENECSDELIKDFADIDKVVCCKSQCYKMSNCGIRTQFQFILNLPFFTEAQCHNTCLNRKVCIDANGDIKNCPAMAKSYGNIKDTTLEEAINKPGFKDLWFINKDKIDVCKDCEFRYMCTDCRAFIKDPENIYSQPAKCTYNPYICLWEGQEGYVPVEECGTYSRETGFVPDKKKIKALNKKIWGEE